MSRYSLSLVLILALQRSVLAQPDPAEYPKDMLAFLKKEMSVAVGYAEGTTGVTLSIYDEEEYAVARDIVRGRGTFIDAQELAKHHAIVRAKLNEQFADLNRGGEPNNSNVRVYPLRSKSLGVIKWIGADYVLVELDGKESSRLVLRKDSIDRIHLDADPVSFTVRAPAAR